MADTHRNECRTDETAQESRVPRSSNRRVRRDERDLLGAPIVRRFSESGRALYEERAGSNSEGCYREAAAKDSESTRDSQAAGTFFRRNSRCSWDFCRSGKSPRVSRESRVTKDAAAAIPASVDLCKSPASFTPSSLQVQHAEQRY